MNNVGIKLAIIDNSDSCVIHFSSRGKKTGKFDRYPVPPNVSNIYINPANASWYLKGLSSLGETLQDSLDFFSHIISQNNFKKVICIGSSMGAFGAALFASRLNVSCICFGPELSLNIYGGFSAQDKIEHIDVFGDFQPSDSLLITGLACPTDTLISVHFQSIWPTSKLIILPKTGNETARYLQGENKLLSLITSYIEGESIEAYAEYKEKNNAILSLLEGVTLGNINLKILQGYFQIVGEDIILTEKLKLAEHFTSRNIFPIAESILQDVISRCGPLSEAIFLLAKLCRKTKRNDQALVLFKQLESNPEYRLQGLWGQSMIQQKMGNLEEANGLYSSIIKGASTLAIVKESNKLLVINSSQNQSPASHENLILTTFPAHKSNNVGDSMIAHSALSMIKARYNEFPSFTLFREESLDKYKDGSLQSIIAPGFSVSNNVYPTLFKLYSDLERLPNFYPIGCSFQHEIASQRVFDEYKYNPETIHFLKLITNKSGPLPCRDQLIVDLLLRYNIPAVYSGDLVLFDENYINTDFVPITNIKSVVFTIQHHPKYQEQSFTVLSLIKKRFPKAKLHVAFHSKESPYSRTIANYAKNIGFEELHLYGPHKNLDIYDCIDFHVGYRLHGHISFLRRRKATILLVEDARSYGFSRTDGTQYGCIDALDENTELPRENVCDELDRLLSTFINNDFLDFHYLFGFIDLTYNDIISPYFDDVVSHLSKNINLNLEK